MIPRLKTPRGLRPASGGETTGSVRGNRVVVRPAVSSDLTAIVALERSIHEAAHWPAQEYAAMLAPVGNSAIWRYLLVADAQGELLGYAVGKLLLTSAGALGEVENIAVAADSRLQGIGGELIRAVVEWCASHGAKEVELEVRAGNHAAIAMYRRTGWRQTGRRPKYYQDPAEDAVLMTVVLPGGPARKTG